MKSRSETTDNRREMWDKGGSVYFMVGDFRVHIR